MPEDIDEHVAMEFHGLVADLQRNDVARFEEEQKQQAALRSLLRKAIPNQGLSAGELLKKIDGDPADVARKVQDDLDRIERESKVAAEQTKGKQAPLPEGHFPPPPENG